VFYPEDLPQHQWLEYYASRFDTVEINSSFYKLPAKETFKHWREQTPENFVFAVKASGYLTHMKKLKDPAEPLENVLTHSAELGEKRGPIHYLLPPGWRPNLERLENLLCLLPNDIRHVFEFRDPSWQIEEVWSLLREYDVAYCITDGASFHTHILATTDFSYIRMHGREEGSYPDAQLREWADTIQSLLKHGDVYIYFNNDYMGYAVENALTLRNMVGVE